MAILFAAVKPPHFLGVFVMVKKLFLAVLGLSISCMAVAGSATSKMMGDKNLPPSMIELKCHSCHSAEKRVVGPSWASISNKYKGGTNSDAVIMSVVNGSRDIWGTMPMPAYGIKEKKSIADIMAFVMAYDFSGVVDELPVARPFPAKIEEISKKGK
jgi:cytochrome c